MLFTRVLDVAVLLLLGVLVLMPRPDAKVKPALAVDAQQRDRVAELQTRLLANPADASAALELSDIFVSARRPDWALAVLRPALDADPNDHRLHARRSLALIEHFDPGPAHQAVMRAVALCEAGSSAPCAPAERDRLALLHSTLERLKDLDMRKDPNTAKERIIQALRPAYIPRQRRADGGRP